MNWQQGAKAFQEGDYLQAQRLFAALSKDARDEVLRRRALYGLACAKLVLATNQEEYNAASALWELWSRISPKGDDEDPRMLTPLLPRLGPPLEAPVLPPKADSSPTPQKLSPMAVVKIVKDRECEKLQRDSEREIQRLRSQIRTLRHQLEALETIHRKIEEKKKEVSSP